MLFSKRRGEWHSRYLVKSSRHPQVLSIDNVDRDVPYLQEIAYIRDEEVYFGYTFM